MFCQVNGLTECIKEWGPKKHASSLGLEPISMQSAGELECPKASPTVLMRHIQIPSPTPSRAITVYNASLDSKDAMLLQWVYAKGHEADAHWSTQLFQLFRTFRFDYGASMAHPTLLPAVCAYTVYCEHGTFEDYCMCEYEQRTCSALQSRLQNAFILDEGDLFAVALLAMCSVREENVMSLHIKGFSAITETLFERAKGDITRYTFARFWEMARDEIVRHAWDCNSEKSSESGGIRQLDNTFQKVTSKSIFEKRVQYEKELEGDQTCSRFVRLFSTTWQQFLSLETLVHSKLNSTAPADSEHEVAHTPATPPDIYLSLYSGIDGSELLCYAVTKLREAVQLRLSGHSTGTKRREARRAATCLLLRQLCRMLLVIHEAPSPQRGVTSPAFVTALTQLFSLLYCFKEKVSLIESSTCKCGIADAESGRSYGFSTCRLHRIKCSYHCK